MPDRERNKLTERKWIDQFNMVVLQSSKLKQERRSQRQSWMPQMWNTARAILFSATLTIKQQSLGSQTLICLKWKYDFGDIYSIILNKMI